MIVPYITKAARLSLREGCKPLSPGELTYCFQQSMKRYLESKPQSYAAYAECLGALLGAALDLIWRKVIPYEIRKLRENGDVWND